MSAVPESRSEAQVILGLGPVPWESAMVAALRHPASGLSVVRRCLDAADVRAAVDTTGAGRVLITAALPMLDLDVVRTLQDAGVAVIGVYRGALDDGDPTAADDRAQLEAWQVDHVVPFVAEQPGRVAMELLSLTGSPAEMPEAHVPPPRPVRPHIVVAAPQHQGQLHVVWGPPGSSGRSTLAITLAEQMAATGSRVLLIDADTDAPSLASMLAIVEPGGGLLPALRRSSAGRLESTDLAEFLVALQGNLRVLCGVPAPTPRADLRPAALTRVLEAARQAADVVVVDIGSVPVPAPGGADNASWAIVEAMNLATDLHVVGSADPVSLIRLVQALESLADHEIADPHVWVTRLRSSVVHGSSSRAIVTALAEAGVRVTPTFVPDDPEACDRALRDGAMLAECAPSSPIRRVVGEWVRRHVAPPTPHADHLASGRVRARVTA